MDDYGREQRSINPGSMHSPYPVVVILPMVGIVTPKLSLMRGDLNDDSNDSAEQVPETQRVSILVRTKVNPSLISRTLKG